METLSEEIKLSYIWDNPQAWPQDWFTYSDNTSGCSDILTSHSRTSYNTFNHDERGAEVEGQRLIASEHSEMMMEEDLEHHDNGFLHGFFNFLKSYIGLGVLSSAHNMRHSGIILGLVTMMFSAFLSFYGWWLVTTSRRIFLREHYEQTRFLNLKQEQSMTQQKRNERKSFQNAKPEMLMKINTRKEASNYEHNDVKSLNSDFLLMNNGMLRTYIELGRHALGDRGNYFIIIMIVIQQLSVVTAYLYFMDEYFKSYIVVFGVIPLVMYLNIKQISYISMISILLIALSLGSLFGKSIADINKGDKDNFRYFEFLEYPLFFGVAIFMFEGDIVVINIENSLKKPRQIYSLIPLTLIIALTAKSAFVWVSYIAYVNDADDIQINSLDDSTLKDLLKISYTIAISLSIPIQLYPISDICYRSTLLDPYFELFRAHPKYKFYIGALVSMIIWEILALIIPSLSAVLNVTGASIGVWITILIPILFYHTANKGNISRPQWWFDWILFIFTFIMGLISLVASIVDQWYTTD